MYQACLAWVLCCSKVLPGWEEPGGTRWERPGLLAFPVPPVTFSFFPLTTQFLASDFLSREVGPESFLEPLASFWTLWGFGNPFFLIEDTADLVRL